MCLSVAQTSNFFFAQDLKQNNFHRRNQRKLELSLQYKATKEIKLFFPSKLLGTGCKPCKKSNKTNGEEQIIDKLHNQIELHLSEIRELKLKLAEHIKQQIKAPVQAPIPEIAKRDIVICQFHKKQFSGFCQQDNILICQVCLETLHSNHVIENIQEIAAQSLAKVGVQGAQMVQRKQNFDIIINFFQKGKVESQRKTDLMAHFINQKIDATIKGLMIKRNQYQFQIQQWKQSVQEEIESLITSWEQIKQQKIPQNVAELLNLDKIFKN